MADVNLDNNISVSGHDGTVSDDMPMSSVADIDSKEAIVTFNGIPILNLRDKYSVELHLSCLHLVGETNDFTIQYSSIVRLFCLPGSNQPQPYTFVVITLDPPIRVGETLHPHIVMQFETDCEIKSPPCTSNEPPYKGLIHRFFTKILRTLSSTKITRPGVFRSMRNGYAVNSTLNDEAGILYPLAKCFFFLPEPPSLFHYTEIDYVELQGEIVPGSSKGYFDLLVRLRTEQEHLFKNIRRREYYYLKEYFSYIGLKVISSDESSSDSDGEEQENRKRNKKDPNAPKAMTPYACFLQAERENVRKENPGITWNDFGRIMGDKWRNMSAAEREHYEAKSRADKKRYLDEIVEYNHRQQSNMASRNLSEGKTLESGDDEDEEGSSTDNSEEDADSDDDPNTPRRLTTAFVFFARAERENVKKENPSANFARIGRILGEKWRNMSAAEKEPYHAMAKADFQPY
ncbi:FACT complex subunit SSRP1-like [Silene latifolia]|uniref:FACT complex subunit SSRP1-like n=1 Tax=Silene latifolia TaxID=37657 RepID=UPI003D77CF2C